MAELLAAFDAYISREFSFVQELVWLDPRRNPFPQCTDKILAGLKNLRVLFQRISGELDRCRKLRELATQFASVVEKDAVAFIDYRRCYVKEATTAAFTMPRVDVEHTVDNIIIQHLDHTWMDIEDNALASGVATLLEAKGIDWKLLHRCITQFLETVIKPGGSFSFGPTESLSDVSASIPLPPRQFVNHQEESCLSDALKDKDWQNDGEVEGAGDKQPSMDASCSDESYIGAEISSPGANRQGADRGGQRDGRLVSDPTAPTNLSSLSVHPSAISATEEIHEILEDRRQPSASVSMTMKASMRDAHNGEPWWHIMLALENKSSNELAVDVLSFWSLLGDRQPSTIRWPKGDIVLRAQDSFVCYSIRWPCHGTYNSPLLGFTWTYSIISTSPSVGETTTSGTQSTAQVSSKRWLGKRVRSVLSWLRPSKIKRQKTQAPQYDD